LLHMAYKMKYQERPAVHDIPYGGIETLRPEIKKTVEIFMLKYTRNWRNRESRNEGFIRSSTLNVRQGSFEPCLNSRRS
jgi:hypothetical protein